MPDLEYDPENYIPMLRTLLQAAGPVYASLLHEYPDRGN